MDFTADKIAGCSPLVVSFTNASTGVSASATYTWEFDNGNTSLLKNPAAIFRDEKSYTVTLTVRDGNQSLKKTQLITVYKKPSVEFISSEAKGCFPLPVTFTSKSTAGDGNISRYFWDFGDGITGQSTDSQAVHTYNFVQNASLSLTVTNSYGCYNTLKKNELITILPELKAAFTADKSVLCTLSEAAGFTNTSTGPGTLSYSWDFGDGGTATAKTPVHLFNTIGTYPVRLAVSSTEGCTDTLVKSAYINVANFKTDLQVPAILCNNNGIEFTNKTTPASTRTTWDFGDGYVYNYSQDKMFHSYYSAGTYTVKVTNEFGNCKDETIKVISVKQSPLVKGFVVDYKLCGAPVTVTYRDTTAGAVKWKWSSDWPYSFNSTEQAPSYNYTSNYNYYTFLTVTNADGCSASTGKQVYVAKPYIVITSPSTGMSGEIRSCGPVPIPFSVNTNVIITAYKWNFGDGNTSTEKEPVHTYNKPGDYRVTLTYATADGCTGSVNFDGYVVVRDKVKADFTASATDICGNTPVTFKNTSGNTVYYYWDFGKGYFQPFIEQYREITTQFFEAGTYTISLIATDWVCADTMTKKDYIKISPPFPKISSFANTCEGDRNVVTFNQASRQTESWKWDFGDGATYTPTTDEPVVKHTYSKTGSYKVVLTNTNGSCTVKDSTHVTVLLKQKPVLAVDKTSVCTWGQVMNMSIDNLEKNPSASSYYYGYSFRVFYADGNYLLSDGPYAQLQNLPLTRPMYNFYDAREGIRAITISDHFGCIDSTNVIALKFTGPKAGFKTVSRPCMTSNVVILQDSSKAEPNTTLVKWEWNFGDGKTEAYTSRTEVSHTYFYPGVYYVTVKVTDATGCYASYQAPVDARMNVLNADFTASATSISPGTAIYFNNTSTSSDNLNTSYRWMLGDGSVSTSNNITKTYTVPGTYIVKLIAVNTLMGCTDTAEKTIIVKYVNAAFTFNASYLTNNSCPPVLVRFASNSYNTVKTRWNFGDGTIAEGQQYTSHVYTKTGVFKITLETESDNGTIYTTVDSVVIKQPGATLSSDILKSCTAETITLSASAEKQSVYFWDTGDGTVQAATDSFFQHRYAAAGVYSPNLVVRDVNGCTTSVGLGDKIVIDSLFISLANLPSTICSPKELLMAPVINSVAADQAQQSLMYHWDFGTGNQTDTADTRTPLLNYQTPGNYTVSLKVSSPYGCMKQVNKSIVAYQGLGGGIQGVSETCPGTLVQLTGTTQLPGQPLWQWVFDDGTSSQQQKPPAKKYSVGAHITKLLVNNNGCVDTVTHTLQVHEKPQVGLSAHRVTVCEGAAISITASGGDTYRWTPATGLSNDAAAGILASPLTATTYTVTAGNVYGCVSTDSVKVDVVHPFNLQLPPAFTVCSGNSVLLKASGAYSYRWIGNTATLNNVTVADPVATPLTNTLYTLVGQDENKCFTDTATTQVTVLPVPTVDAGQSVELLTGTPLLLQPVASSDVVKWTWTPGSYLSCTNCPTPEAKPLTSVNYKLTVENSYGCIAADTLSVNLICSQSRVYIPNIFTPDHDGKNDGFAIKGEGIKVVKSFRIFNRWGQQVFERINFLINDKTAAWDGRFKGQIVPIGTYVYVAEMECNEQHFTRKGVVTVVY